MQAELQAGSFVYRPPWAAGGGGGSLTGHSGGRTYAAFLTPSSLEHRPPSATPTLVSRQRRVHFEPAERHTRALLWAGQLA